MTWTRAVRRVTLTQSGFAFERPYLSGENGAELDFGLSLRGEYAKFTLRQGGRDFEFSAERDHDIPPLSQTVSDTRPKTRPLVLGPDCLVRMMPKRETRRSWTEDVVAEAAEGIKSALRALHELAPDFCSSPIQRIRFHFDFANEFVLHSDYPENIRPGETPVWFMRCAEEYAWFPKVTWASDPPPETWTADVNASGSALPRFTMTGEVTMPDFFTIRCFPPRIGIPFHFGRIVSSRARNVIEAVAPDELAYRPLSIEMPAHMLPAASYFLIEPTRKAQMIDWDRSPKVLSGGELLPPTHIAVGLHPTKITVGYYHHIGHLIFRSRKPGDPHIWREVAPVSEKFDYRAPRQICMSESMWTALWEQFPGQLDQRSRSA
jgi:hypothetical protein